MKKNIWQILAVGIAVVTCLQPAMARQLSSEEALTRVYKVPFSAPAGKRLASKGVKPRLIHTAFTADKERPAYYVFGTDRADGFIIASADDRLEPVLGVADSGSFSEIPENMQWWLSQYEEEIAAYYDANGTDEESKPFASVYEAYDSWTPIEPICKTKWNQTNPFNLKCPTVNGSRAVTGCVATCLAQAIKAIGYFKGSGSVSYSTNGATVEFDYSKYTPDFSLMKDVYDSSATTKEKNAVAELMFACGAAVNTAYSSVSGATINLTNIRKYMGFGTKSFVVYRDGTSTIQWETFCYETIKAGKPLCYGGSGSGGHAFICDGYSEDGFFHFNWGWGGTADGYFRLSSLNPRYVGTGGFAGGYSFGQNATVLMTPSDEMINLTTVAPVRVMWDNQTAINYQGASGDTHTFGYKYVLRDPSSASVGMGLLLENRDGVSEDIYIAPTKYVSLSANSPQGSFSVKIPAGLLENDTQYDAYPAYSVKAYKDNGYWRPYAYLSNSNADHYTLKVSSTGRISISVAPADTPKLIVSDWKVNEFYAGDNVNHFECVLTNYGKSDFSEEIDLALYKGGVNYKIKNVKSYLPISSGESLKLDGDFSLIDDNNKQIEPGKYELRLLRVKTDSPVTDAAVMNIEVMAGKRPEGVQVTGSEGSYQIALWANGKMQPLGPVALTMGDEFKGVTSVVSSDSQNVDYSLAFFKHGETTNPIAKYAINNAVIKGDGSWKQDKSFSVKPDLAVGIYTMAFVTTADNVRVSYPVDVTVGVTKDGISYGYDEEFGGLTVTGFNGTLPVSLVIPAEVAGTPVVAVAPGAFDRCTGLEELTLPGSLKNIGLNAFRGAVSLRSVMFNAETAPFVNSVMGFGSVNPNVAFYVDADKYETYDPAFHYRGRLYAKITELKAPAEVEAVGGVAQVVTFEVAPAENVNPNYIVEVSDLTILNASAKGNELSLSPLSEGVATVTLKSVQPGVAPVTITVKVSKPEKPIEITVTPVDVKLTEGESVQLAANIANAPEGAAVIWTSDNEAVATVNENGLVTAIAAGDAVITASCGTAHAECTVSVAKAEPVYSIKISSAELNMKVGEKQLLWVEFEGDAPDGFNTVWTSSNEAVATYANGLVTALSAGETVITAVYGTATASCVVKVTDLPDSITEVDADSDAEYFDLSGRRLLKPSGIVIVRKNGKSELRKL